MLKIDSITEKAETSGSVTREQLRELLDLVLRVQSVGLYAEFFLEGEGADASVYVRPKDSDSEYILFEFFSFENGTKDCQKCINGLKMILKKAQDAGTSKGR